ncbi:hypothetical protein CRG98_017832 [Punica granatum]|uniref:Uncharacterized protein n=2 Tax=Punica granatum TaxID=22663 RepID=A0A2I0JZT3_PUNGR|nr:hypothetical protein CRG98_017832 [Punica granatum]
MEIGGGADKACSEDKNVAGSRTVAGGGGGGKGLVNRASSSAMLVVMLAASWLTVPSSTAMRAWSSEVDDVSETHGRGALEDIGGGRCIEGAPEYAGGTPTGVGGGGACVGGG